MRDAALRDAANIKGDVQAKSVGFPRALVSLQVLHNLQHKVAVLILPSQLEDAQQQVEAAVEI